MDGRGHSQCRREVRRGGILHNIRENFKQSFLTAVLCNSADFGRMTWPLRLDGLERRGRCQLVVGHGANRSACVSASNNLGPVGSPPCQQGKSEVWKRKHLHLVFKWSQWAEPNAEVYSFILDELVW